MLFVDVSFGRVGLNAIAPRINANERVVWMWKGAPAASRKHLLTRG